MPRSPGTPGTGHGAVRAPGPPVVYRHHPAVAAPDGQDLGGSRPAPAARGKNNPAKNINGKKHPAASIPAVRGRAMADTHSPMANTPAIDKDSASISPPALLGAATPKPAMATTRRRISSSTAKHALRTSCAASTQ